MSTTGKKVNPYNSEEKLLNGELGNQQQGPQQNNGGYTLDDVNSVVDTGKLPEENKTESYYDMLMREAEKEYERQKIANEQSAVAQAAAAGAQYREVNRNLNELNKLNGRAGTGYAGDTSIYAYNAYRNSVNESYAKASENNNSLYSYYLQNMASLNEQKENAEYRDWQKGITEREMALTEQNYTDEREGNVLDVIQNDLLTQTGAFDENGVITDEYAKKAYESLIAHWGGLENVPASSLERLKINKGFDKWLAQHEADYILPETKEDLNKIIENISNAEDWETAYKKAVEKIEGLKDKLTPEEYQAMMEKVGAYNPSTSGAKWEISGIGSGKEKDDFKLTINGVEYDLQTGAKQNDKTLIATLNKLATGDENKSPSTKDEGWIRIKGADSDSSSKPGKVVVHEGEMYIYTKKGWCKVKSDQSKVSKAITAYLNNSVKEHKPKSEVVSTITNEINAFENYDDIVDSYQEIMDNMQYYKEKLGDDEYNKLVEMLDDKKYDLATSKAKTSIDKLENSDNFIKDYREAIEDLERLKGNIAEEEYNELANMLDAYDSSSNSAEWGIDRLGSGKKGDDFDLTINGKTYDLKTGGTVSAETKQALNKLATGDENKSPSTKGEGALRIKNNESDSSSKPGKVVVYEGKMYIYTKKGWAKVVSDNSRVDNAINAYLKYGKK